MKFKIVQTPDRYQPTHLDSTVGPWYVAVETGNYDGYLHKDLFIRPEAATGPKNDRKYTAWYRTRKMARDTVRRYKNFNI